MKRFFVFLKMIFVLPSMVYSRKQALKEPYLDRIELTKKWARIILKKYKVKINVKNTNLIPLEDGYTFISNHESKFDGLLLLSANPLNFSFFVNAHERLPYMNSYLELSDSYRYNRDSRDDFLISMSQNLLKHKNYHLFFEDTDHQALSPSQLDAAYISKTAIIPVAIRNSKSVIKFGRHMIEVIYCTPLHYEEYGALSAQSTLQEIKTRIELELKQGETHEIS
jgi:1-acyl-sn-glycerol-3-phosphate acyltransferase